MRHAHSGKIPFDCPFFSTAGHTLTGQAVMLGCSKYLGSLTVCPLARRKKGRMGFCNVRYCRGAESLLASPTFALLEGLLFGYELLVFYSQLCPTPGFRGPQAPDAGKG